MAETKKEVSTIPVTKFYVPTEAKKQIQSLASGPGYYNDPSKIISDLESTGNISDGNSYGIDKKTLDAALRGVLPFDEGVRQQLKTFKDKEASLTGQDYQEYISLLNVANAGSADFKKIQGEAKEKFKQDLIQTLGRAVGDRGLVEKLAEKAAQRFVVERKTGEQSLVDFLAKEGNLDRNIIAPSVQDLDPNPYIPQGAGDFGNEISRVSKLSEQTKVNEEAKASEKQTQALAESQRTQSGDLFKQALQAFQQPLPTFTPEFSEAALGKIQGDITRQGTSALSRTESDFAERGLTGSSIEAFGKAQTEGNITDAFANATLNFLQQSGTSSQRNREFLANQLFTQAQSVLGASQQNQALGVNQGQYNQNQLLAQNQLAQQIAQFNQQFQESQRQFGEQLGYQKEQAQSNLALLIQQMSQGSGRSALGAIGSGVATGIGTGALIGGPLGAGVGAGAGLATGLASYFGQK